MCQLLQRVAAKHLFFFWHFPACRGEGSMLCEISVLNMKSIILSGSCKPIDLQRLFTHRTCDLSADWPTRPIPDQLGRYDEKSNKKGKYCLKCCLILVHLKNFEYQEKTV